MKKFMHVCLLGMLSVFALNAQTTPKKWVLPGPSASAATTMRPATESSQKKSVFVSKAEAEAAYATGDYAFYDPRYTALFGTRLPDDKTTKKFALERDTIAEMLTFGNKYAWVILPEGTEARFELNLSGKPLSTPYALHKCGNPIRSISYPRTRVTTQVVQAPVPVLAPAPDPVVVQAPAPKVYVQVPAPEIILTPAPPTYVTAPAPQVTIQQQAPVPVYGPSRPSVLPQTRFYDAKPNFQEPMAPMVPEVKGIHWGWKVLGGAILGFAIYKALDHKKDTPQQRAVITDPPTAGGLVVAHW